jgi:uncharacterized RDD family membrane protein YckC
LTDTGRSGTSSSDRLLKNLRCAQPINPSDKWLAFWLGIKDSSGKTNHMNWYYADGAQQMGPITESDLEGLIQSGKINVDTLVWHEGMDNWQPLGQVKPGAVPAAPPLAEMAQAGGGVTCSQCGNAFAADEVIRYGDVYVCANCKPVFVQRLKEGAVLPSALNYAGFWIRFAAIFVDGILLWIVNFIIGLMAGLGVGQAVGVEPRAGQVALQIFLSFVQIAVALSYETIMIGKYGATLGKMACRLKVVTAEGKPVSYARALGRYFAKILSGLICGIGYIMAGFDSQTRALHDRICDTRVVKL